MADIYPFPLPRQQLPQPTDRLSDGFLRALPAPVGLWMPSKLAQAAADFTPLPQKHFGALNGGVTTTPGGFGVLGAVWHVTGTSQSINLGAANSIIPASATEATIFALVRPSNLSTDQRIFSFGLASASTAFGLFSGRTTVNTFGCFGRTAASGLVQINSTDTYTVGQMHLIAATVKGTTLSLFVDGIPEGNATCDIGVTLQSMGSAIADAVAFGPPGIGSTPNFAGDGLIFGVVLKALSAAQLLDLYSCLRTGEPFPLFQPQTAAMMLGSAAAPAGGGGGFLIGGGIGDFLCAA